MMKYFAVFLLVMGISVYGIHYSDEAINYEEEAVSYLNLTNNITNNITSGSDGLWYNVSGTATYYDNVNITGNLTTNYIGLLGYDPEYPIHYEGEPNINRLISFVYGQGSPLASPFNYEVYLPQTVATSNQIIAVTNAKIYSDRTSAGNQYIYGNYFKVGTDSVFHPTGSQFYDFNNVELRTPAGAFMETTSSVQEFTGDNYMLHHSLGLGASSGSEYLSGSHVTYSTKANNIFGGTRTYETYGHHVEGFENCQSYDTCYGYYAENSNSKFDGDVEVVDELTVQDLVTGSNAGTSLCVDTNNKLCLCGSCA